MKVIAATPMVPPKCMAPSGCVGIATFLVHVEVKPHRYKHYRLCKPCLDRLKEKCGG